MCHTWRSEAPEDGRVSRRTIRNARSCDWVPCDELLARLKVWYLRKLLVQEQMEKGLQLVQVLIQVRPQVQVLVQARSRVQVWVSTLVWNCQLL